MIAALKIPPMKTDLRRVDSKLVAHFQEKTPAAWVFCPAYLTAKQKIASMRVTNDYAECAVKLATDFNNVLTLDEAERQLIFQIVECHRNLLTIPLKINFKAELKVIIHYYF